MLISNPLKWREKECTLKKLLAKNLKTSNTEGDKLQLSTFLLINLFFRIFLNRFELRRKVCVILIPICKIRDEKVFRSHNHFLKTFQPNSQETAKNIEKRFLQKCLRQYHNRCSLVYSASDKCLLYLKMSCFAAVSLFMEFLYRNEFTVL